MSYSWNYLCSCIAARRRDLIVICNTLHKCMVIALHGWRCSNFWHQNLLVYRKLKNAKKGFLFRLVSRTYYLHIISKSCQMHESFNFVTNNSNKYVNSSRISLDQKTSIYADAVLKPQVTSKSSTTIAHKICNYFRTYLLSVQASISLKLKNWQISSRKLMLPRADR